VAIPLAAHLVYRYAGSRVAGLTAAVLVAVSFNHVAWGGLGLTEPLGVLAVLSALAATLARRRQGCAPELASWGDLGTGALWGLAALVRYEYAILLLPSLLVAARPFSWARAANLAAGWSVVVALGLALVRPFAALPIGSLASTIMNFVPLLAVVAAGFTVSVMFARRATPTGAAPPPHAPGERTPAVRPGERAVRPLIWALWLGAAALALPFPFTTGAQGFAATDLPLTVAALAGLTLMLRDSRYRITAVYLIVCAALLAGVYARVNPTMQRYGTHLIPFLLIPAGLGGAALIHRAMSWRPLRRAGAAAAITLLAAGQTAVAYQGLRFAPDSLWFRPGYEAVAAQWVSAAVPRDTVLVTSLPEPYRFYSRHSVQSISDAPPYLYAGLPSDQRVAVVQDAPMRRLFPQFSDTLSSRLKPAATHQISEPLRYKSSIITKPEPVNLYLTTYGELKALVRQ
jgi:4-amino-4-deoxy-L-arabinose transferase-like glycosyltransferase